MKSPLYTQPAVKCETAASGIASFLESYRDLIWMMRWLLAPAILLTLSLVIANAISISVRERRREFAVLRVLGFRPRHILVLVVGEAVALGGFAGLASAGGDVLRDRSCLRGLQLSDRLLRRLLYSGRGHPLGTGRRRRHGAFG